MTWASTGQLLVERGWAIVDLPDTESVVVGRDLLLGQLRQAGLRDLQRLEDYHQFVDDDDAHIDIWHELATWFWTLDISRSIVEANLDLFRDLAGTDLHIQRYPYLRAVRPGKPGDAAPLHRDTYYGSSPFELVVLIPFTDTRAEGAVRVISGSHAAPDADYPFTQTVNPDVEVRSKKHRLGYSYAPRLLDPALAERAEPVPLEVGQALLFVLSLVHGAGVNQTDSTRFSTDIRLVNSLQAVAHSRGVHDDYYVPLCSSPVSKAGARYLAANAAADPPPRP